MLFFKRNNSISLPDRPTVLFALSWLFLAVGLLLYLWVAVDAASSAYEAWQFRPYNKPYQARVVGFDRHFGGRSSSTAPIVEVRMADGESFRFTSHKYSSVQLIALSEKVDLVPRPGTNLLGQPVEILEVNNAWHLWLGDLMVALIMPAVVILAVLWPRIMPPRSPGKYTLPP